MATSSTRAKVTTGLRMLYKLPLRSPATNAPTVYR